MNAHLSKRYRRTAVAASAVLLLTYLAVGAVLLRTDQGAGGLTPKAAVSTASEETGAAN
jgi:hypothetical protein